MTMQTLRPITALAAASPRRKVTIFRRRTSGPRGGCKDGPHGRKGSVTPLALRERGTIISPLLITGKRLNTAICSGSSNEKPYLESQGVGLLPHVDGPGVVVVQALPDADISVASICYDEPEGGHHSGLQRYTSWDFNLQQNNLRYFWGGHF